MNTIHTQYIDGGWTAAGDRQLIPVTAPASGEEIAAIAAAKPEDVARAISAVGAAQAEWAATPPAERARHLRAIAKSVASRRAAIARAITDDQGKPLAEAEGEIDGVVHLFEFSAERLADFAFAREDDVTGIRRTARRIPVGPVTIIGTWNFPVETIAVHMAPSLAAGCTSVAIANADTPGGPVAFFEALAEADLPPGIVNLLLGNAPDCSAALIADPGIGHVSYTGSVRVGRILAEQAARAIKRATLELGGNAPAIVLKRGDLDKAVADIGGKRFWNAGQVCTAPNRILVHESEYDAFAEAMAKLAESVVVGDPLDPVTQMGPLANAGRVSFMEEIVSDGVEQGADLLAGGARLERPGNFFAPTVLGRMGDEALGMRDEVFGPVACLSSYGDVDEAIARANACELGLSAYVYGPDQQAAEAVAGQLDVGAVGVNQMVVAFMDAPFGGVKESGLGFVGGPDAISEYLRPRLSAALA